MCSYFYVGPSVSRLGLFIVGKILGDRGQIMGTKFRGLILKYVQFYEKIEYHTMVNFLDSICPSPAFSTYALLYVFSEFKLPVWEYLRHRGQF